MVKNKIYKIIKAVIYILVGLSCFIFNETYTHHVEIVVGSVMLLYFINGLYNDITKKNFTIEGSPFVRHIILLILALIMLFINKTPEATLTMWCVWEIISEGEEVANEAFAQKNLVIRIINVIESIIAIVLSILLIREPALEHVTLHMYYLGIELILNILLNYFDERLTKNVSD